MNAVEPRFLEDIVARLARALGPDRIVLFGSRARGDAREDSDWDVAVIARSTLPWYERETLAYRALRGLCVPVEVVVLTPAEVDAERAVPGSLAWRLEREGRVVYDAAGTG